MAKQVRLFSITDIKLAVLESNPPQLAVSVTGLSTTSGWKNVELVPLEKTLSPDGILDLDFVGEPPSGKTMQVLTPVAASVVWTQDVDRLVGVKVYSRSGDVTRLRVELAKNFTELATTLAVGEEGDGPTTKARGEEMPFPKTMMVGEEGPTLAWGEHPTTFRFGEEWPTVPWGEGPKTMRIGEEGPKLARGETSPTVDDPKAPMGEDDWFDPAEFNPFGRF